MLHVLMNCLICLGERKILFKTLSELRLTVFSFMKIFSEESISLFIDKAVIKFLYTSLYFKI